MHNAAHMTITPTTPPLTKGPFLAVSVEYTDDADIFLTNDPPILLHLTQVSNDPHFLLLTIHCPVHD